MFGTSLVILSNYHDNKEIAGNDSSAYSTNKEVVENKKSSVKVKDEISSYVSNNVTGAVNENAGSNSTRFSLIRSEIHIFLEHPVTGVGSGLGTAYTAALLQGKETNSHEIEACLSLQKEKGILKSGFPTVCEFSRRLAENGVIGTFLFFSPVIVLGYLLIKKHKMLLERTDKTNDEICTYISFLVCLVSGCSGTLNTMQTYWLLLGLSFAYALKREY